MYTREQILDEIKRIAKKKEGRSLTQEEFELSSTIPISTLKFYMGTWKRALKEAGLESMYSEVSESFGKPEPKNDDELLLDLIRLYEDSGEVPSLALIKSKGKYSDHYYKAKWKSISEAFLKAREKFPKKSKDTQVPKAEPTPKKDTQKEEKIKKNDPMAMAKTLQEIPSDLGIPNYEKTVSLTKEDLEDKKKAFVPPKKKEEIENKKEAFVPPKKPVKKTIKFIPQTIKPKNDKKKSRSAGEPISFRGLTSAPANKQGVLYLFGMVSYELGYLIESIMTEYPDCEGKRCIDQKNDRWEKVTIEFEFKSSYFKVHGHDEKQCDLIVCWLHDWEECPLEVLELRSIIKRLDNSL